MLVEKYSHGLEPDVDRIWSTDHALSLTVVPRRLAVVEGGNRGVEFASIYRNRGAGVALIEKEKHVLPRLDPEFSDRYKKAFRDRKIEVLTGTSVSAAR